MQVDGPEQMQFLMTDFDSYTLKTIMSLVIN